MTSLPARTGLDIESWDDLYDFLDPGRHEKPDAERNALAEARCLEIRRKLVCFFSARGCRDAEDLAAETVLRVAARCKDTDASGYPDRTGYFYGVARNVLHEWHRRASVETAGRESFRAELMRLPVPDPRSWAEQERVHRHLGLCLAKLTERGRRLILNYYAEDPAARIERHRALADEFGKTANALRIEVHRIRKALRDCLFERLRAEADGTAGPRPGVTARRS